MVLCMRLLYDDPMREATITADVDEHGRVTIPKPARKKLGIEAEDPDEDPDIDTPTQATITVRVDE